MHHKSFTKILVGFLFALFIYGCTEEENPVNTSKVDLLMVDLSFQPSKTLEGDDVTIIAQTRNIGTNIASTFTVEIFKDANFNSIADPTELIHSQQYIDLSPNDSIITSIVLDSVLAAKYQIISQILFAHDENISNNKLVKLFEVFPLLFNTSFEKNGRFSSDGWSLPAQSDSSTDVPPEGGSYSLELEAMQPPVSCAQITVPVNAQLSNYKLTFWAKSTSIEINGIAILSLLRNGSVIKEKSIPVNDIFWRSYSIADSFSVASGDSFMVQLTAISQLFLGKTYFDLCKFGPIE